MKASKAGNRRPRPRTTPSEPLCGLPTPVNLAQCEAQISFLARLHAEAKTQQQKMYYAAAVRPLLDLRPSLM